MVASKKFSFSATLATTLHGRVHRLVALQSVAGLLPTCPAGESCKKSAAPLPTASYAPAPRHRRRPSVECVGVRLRVMGVFHLAGIAWLVVDVIDGSQRALEALGNLGSPWAASVVCWPRSPVR